jgi:hypothetical protein
MKRTVGLVSTIFALGWSFTPMLAHHGSVWFDKSKSMTITGVITDFEWATPHTYVFVDVKNKRGAIENWAVEANSRLLLTRSGWTFEALRPGATITFTAHPAKPDRAFHEKIHSAKAKAYVDAHRYVAGGCASTSNLPQRMLGYGPSCLVE